MAKRGRTPGQGTFSGGRKRGVPNKKGRKEQEVVFRCSQELFEALSLAAVAVCEESVNLYARKFLESTHQEQLNQVREAHKEKRYERERIVAKMLELFRRFERESLDH